MINRTEVGEAILAEIGSRLYEEWKTQQEELSKLKLELETLKKELRDAQKADDFFGMPEERKAASPIESEKTVEPEIEKQKKSKTQRKKSIKTEIEAIASIVLPKPLRTGINRKFEDEIGQLMIYGYRPVNIGCDQVRFERPKGGPTIVALKKEFKSLPTYLVGEGAEAFRTSDIIKSLRERMPTVGAYDKCVIKEERTSVSISCNQETFETAKTLCEATNMTLTDVLNASKIAAMCKLSIDKSNFAKFCKTMEKNKGKRDRALCGHAPKGMNETMLDMCKEKGVTLAAAMAAQLSIAARLTMDDESAKESKGA